MSQSLRLFLRDVVAGRYDGACLQVIDNGSVLNPCMESLPRRVDIRGIRRLDPKVTVEHAHEHDGVVMITAADLTPQPSWPLTLRLDHGARDGRWKVRALNGTAITWRWQN